MILLGDNHFLVIGDGQKLIVNGNYESDSAPIAFSSFSYKNSAGEADGFTLHFAFFRL